MDLEEKFIAYLPFNTRVLELITMQNLDNRRNRVRHLFNAIEATLFIVWAMQSRFHFGSRNSQNH